jgi:RNA ligase
VSAADYPKFPKIPRFDTSFWLTEKIDGSHGLIRIEKAEGDPNIALENVPKGSQAVVTDGAGAPDFEGSGVYFVRAGSRNRWITPDEDNHGFARWVWINALNLTIALGPGHHYGEWYGKGIQRGYGLDEKRFMLLHVFRWSENPPETDLVEVATVLDTSNGSDLSTTVTFWEDMLRTRGSMHVPGYDRPEGIVIQNHTDRSVFFKHPFDKDWQAPRKLDMQAHQLRRPVAVVPETTAHSDSFDAPVRGPWPPGGVLDFHFGDK